MQQGEGLKIGSAFKPDLLFSLRSLSAKTGPPTPPTTHTKINHRLRTAEQTGNGEGCAAILQDSPEL